MQPQLELRKSGREYKFDLDVSFVSQQSVNKTNLLNGGVELKKRFLLGSIKYKIPVPAVLNVYGGQVKIGAGAGLYQSTELTITHNNTSTDESSYIIIDYKPTLGYHASLEFETFMPNDWAFTIGLLVYQVNYEGESENYSGPDAAAWDYYTNFENMKGGGVDILVSLGKYFW